MSLEEQIDSFLNEKNITPYQHIYNSDGNTGWDIEVLIEEFAERYAQQIVNEVLDKAEKEMFNRIGGIATPDSISGSMQVISEIILKLKNNEK